MPLTKIEISNVTVFDKMTIPFSKGINILIGENGLGKTHIMKLLYSACQASKSDVSFPHKTVMVFRPEFKNADYEKMNFKFVLVIKGHEKTWLPPLKAEFDKRMKRFRAVWNSEVIVMNDNMARECRLIS